MVRVVQGVEAEVVEVQEIRVVEVQAQVMKQVV